MKKILAVDDNQTDCKLLEMALQNVRGYEVVTASSGRSALDQTVQCNPDAVILDLMLPDLSGLDVLKELKKSQPALPVIMLTGLSDVRKAVEAIQIGANNFIIKPFDKDHLLLILRNAVQQNDLLSEVTALRSKAGRMGSFLSSIMGKSPSILAVVRHIQKVADSNLTVLIQGETGTGKEPTARALHEESSRRDGPFVAVDCGALPENLLESELFGHEKGAFSGADRSKPGQFGLAGGGTLFLDEIGNLSFFLQAKLLRAIQERQVRPVGAVKAFPVDVRIIAASNTPLEGAAQSGQFRKDLYYRLAECTIQLPPLRNRREDIPFLAQRFREEACREFQKPVMFLSQEAVSLLEAHAWPGNVRELRNVIRQAVLLTPDSSIHAEHIKALLGSSSGSEAPGPVEVPLIPGMALREVVQSATAQVEKQVISNVLRSNHGNKTQAAKVLDVDYKTFRLKIKKYGLQIAQD